MEKILKKIGEDKRGIATLEILIAMTILILVISATIMLVFGSQTSSVSSETHQESLYKAQELLEEARADARANFSSVVTTAPASDGIYTKNIAVTDIDSLTKQVTSKVTWGTLSTTLTTIVSDWQGSLGMCSPVLFGDWTNPQVYGYVDFPSPNGASGVDIKAAKAYITSDPKSAGTNDFYVVDVSNPNLKPLPILGQFSTSYGLTFVKVFGSYAYVTADSAAYQLLVIDASVPGALDTTKIKAKIDVTAAGDTAYGNTLFYLNKKIYLGLTKSNGPEFYIFCIAPDPIVPACSSSSATNPIQIGSYEVGAAVNSILVKNNTAYLATAANNEVIALDVSNPSSPNPIGNYSSATLTGQSLALDSGSTLYFGRIGGTGNPKLFALNTANLGVPKWTMDMIKQSGVYTMVLRNNLLFMTTADPNDGLQIWDVSAPSGPPTRYDTSPLNIQQGATMGTDCAGNLLYVAQKSNRAMQIVGPFVPEPFDYTFSTAPTDVTLVTGGPAQQTSFTITRISGTSQPVSFSNSTLPTGTVINYSGTSCSPACTTTLTLSAPSGTPTGSTVVTITGTSPVHTTTFNLTINAPAFSYSLSNIADFNLSRGGVSVPVTETVTMSAGSTPQPVTITAPNPPTSPTDITITPNAIQSCTPSSSAPYTCSVTFTYSASALASKKSYNNNIMNASPNTVQSNKFKITVN